MNLLGRLRRSLGQRGLSGTLLQIPRAAVRPLLLAVRTRRSGARAPRLTAAAQPALLHLGSGPERLAGWINVDLYFPAELCLDLTRPLPLPDHCVDAIYSQHLIEHLTKPQTGQLLRECARVLKPGGWLRVSTPDLAYYVRLWEETAASGETHGSAAADALNDIMRLHDHLYIYDYPALHELFLGAGLTQVRRALPRDSRCAYLQGLESRLASAPEEIARQDLIVEGCRPNS